VLLHRLAALVLALAVLGGAVVGVLAWRLAQGPLEVPWLIGRVEAALNQDTTSGRVAIGSAALVWEGFRLGVDRSLDVRLTAVTLTQDTGAQDAGPQSTVTQGAGTQSIGDAAGRQIVTVPRAEISLSLHALLFGRITLRALEIDQGRINLIRTKEGSIVIKAGAPPPNVPAPNVLAPNAPAPDALTPDILTQGAGAAEETKPLLALLTELARPPATDRNATRIGPYSQLRRLRIHDATLVVEDRQLGTTWQAPHAEIDLTRGVRGGVNGTASMSLMLGDLRAQLTGTATLPAGKGPIRLRLRLTPVTPAAIARLVPRAGVLAALDMPVGAEADVQIDDTMRLVELHLALQAGAGAVHIADGVLPLSGATIVADAAGDHAVLRLLRLTVPGQLDQADSVVRVTGSLDRAADHLTASVAIDLDRVDFAALPRVWPAGVARDARAWITENIPAGVAHDGHVELGLEAAPDLSAVTLTRAVGTVAGEGLEVHWLRPVPPIENGVAALNILDPDTLEIVARSGHQRAEPATSGASTTGTPNNGTSGNNGGSGLTLRGGKMRITGLLHRDQFAAIEAQIAGSLPDAIALLRDKRLQLLDRHPLPLNDPAGQMAGTMTLTFPLEHTLTIEQVAVRAHARLDGVHLGGLIGGRDLDQGALDLDANVDGLTVNGKAAIAGIPASMKASMDFRVGGPSQVVQRINLSGQASTRQLAAAGLDAGSTLDGTVGLDATLSERRDGGGEVAVTADLAPTAVTVTPLAWRKPAGTAMTAAGRLLLSHDRLIGIVDLRVNSDGAAASGSITCIGGKPAVVQIDRLVLGRSEARGTIRLPAAETSQGETSQGEAASPIAISVTGPTLDLSAQLTHQPGHPPRGRRAAPSGPHWTLDARFDRVIMAGGRQVTALVARADSTGGLTQRLEVDGLTASQAPFSVRIAPVQGDAPGGGPVPGGATVQGDTSGAAKGRRMFTATAANAGELLAGLDLVSRMQGGRLRVTGFYDDATPEHALDGTAEISDFRIGNAPVLARLLQAMTLYGLVEVLRGPGLGFSQLVAPFRLTDDTLSLKDARAFSSSLGLTAKGSVDLDQERITLDGTIVPAYFFNSLLGQIPLLGRLFSPEQGGGVFAANYAVRGTLDDPAVTVNPLTALTPGFLRGVFGLF
jgi:hypothetical protein